MLTLEAAVALGQVLCQRITQPRYDLWFRDKTKFTVEADQLVVGVANCFYQDWLQKKFADDLRAVAAEILGQALSVTFVIDPELFQADRRRQGDAPVVQKAVPAESLPASAARESTSLELPRLRARRWRKLGDFVVGPCNRVAHAAALGVVEEPGLTPIPLVLHGPVGSGKTHLLEGIHCAVRARYPEARVLSLTAEEFTNRFLASMHHNKQPSFRKQFRECDVLLIDDLQFLAKKTATQVEFLHTLEILQREGRAVVVTCDCHPKLADIFLPELTDRLLGGVVWGVGWPDPATRRAMIRAKTRDGLPWSEEVFAFLAENLRGNVRELEGAIHSLNHLARATDRPITVELAREALAEVLRASIRTVELADIDQAVSAALGLAPGTLQSRQRRWQVSNPRMLAIYLARKHTKATYGEVGLHFGNRNHSTAVAAEKKVRLWLADNEDLLVGTQKVPVREMLEKIEAELLR